jgi:hypothetical protein
MQLLFLYGIRNPETQQPFALPADESWIAKQKLIGLSVPDDLSDRLMYFIETEICGGVNDFLEIFKRCTMMAIPEDKLGEAEALFQRSLGEFYKTKGSENTAGEMVGELPLRARGRGVGRKPTSAV